MADAQPNELKIIGSENRDHFVILNLIDNAGIAYEVKLNSMAAMDILGGISAQLREIIPNSPSWGAPEMKRVQYSEDGETLFFRVFLGDHLYHEYTVARSTSLGIELRAFADRAAARNMAKATHQSPDRKS